MGAEAFIIKSPPQATPCTVRNNGTFSLHAEAPTLGYSRYRKEPWELKPL